MSCQDGLQVSEIPGSDVACSTLNVRKCLVVNGHSIIGGTVNTDGVTVQGDGSLATPIALKAVQHDATLAGSGTVADPLRVAGAASADHIDLVDGAAVPVAPAGVTRIRSVAGVLQVSYNGGAYVNIVTL